MRLAAAESAHNFFLQPVSLRRVFGLDHSFGELSHFFRAEECALRCMARKLEDRVPFVSRQPLSGHQITWQGCGVQAGKKG